MVPLATSLAQTTSAARDGAKREPVPSATSTISGWSIRQDDAEFARRFVPWMTRVRRLAPRYGYHIQKDDEAWEEWFWLYYYLDGYSPRRALAATRAYDRNKKHAR